MTFPNVNERLLHRCHKNGDGDTPLAAGFQRRVQGHERFSVGLGRKCASISGPLFRRGSIRAKGSWEKYYFARLRSAPAAAPRSRFTRGHHTNNDYLCSPHRARGRATPSRLGRGVAEADDRPGSVTSRGQHSAGSEPRSAPSIRAWDFVRILGNGNRSQQAGAEVTHCCSNRKSRAGHRSGQRLDSEYRVSHRATRRRGYRSVFPQLP